MQEPFPELTKLVLHSPVKLETVLPDSFLGGPAPHLRELILESIPFLGLPKLLSSANHLVLLRLFDIPHSGYISPETMVALLSMLSNLRILYIEFKSPQSCPDWESRNLPPLKRSILQALEDFHFKGVTEYLEDLVTSIDAPKLFRMDIRFFNKIDFDIPRLAQFINITPTLREFDEAHVLLESSMSSVELQYRASEPSIHGLRIRFPRRKPDLQPSSIEKVCNSLLPLSTVEAVEDLYIVPRYFEKGDAIENALWLPLFLPFIAVKNLYLPNDSAPGIAAALQELVGSRIAEVLPSLEYISVRGLTRLGPFKKKIAKFVTARQLSGHPVTVSISPSAFG